MVPSAPPASLRPTFAETHSPTRATTPIARVDVAQDSPFCECAVVADNDKELVWHDAHRGSEGLMVVLHGAAEHPVAALQLGSILDPRRRFRVCAPVSPLTVGDHKRAFYRSKSPMEPQGDSFRSAASFVRRAVDGACDHADVGKADVVLVGFSQGAGLATIAALGASDSPPPGTVIVFSSRPYPDELVEWDFARAVGCRMFFAHGTRDRLSPLRELRSFVERFEAHAADVTWQTHPYGHTLEPETIAAATRWLYGHHQPAS